MTKLQRLSAEQVSAECAEALLKADLTALTQLRVSLEWAWHADLSRTAELFSQITSRLTKLQTLAVTSAQDVTFPNGLWRLPNVTDLDFGNLDVASCALLAPTLASLRAGEIDLAQLGSWPLLERLTLSRAISAQNTLVIAGRCSRLRSLRLVLSITSPCLLARLLVALPKLDSLALEARAGHVATESEEKDAATAPSEWIAPQQQLILSLRDVRVDVGPKLQFPNLRALELRASSRNEQKAEPQDLSALVNSTQMPLLERLCVVCATARFERGLEVNDSTGNSGRKSNDDAADKRWRLRRLTVNVGSAFTADDLSHLLSHARSVADELRFVAPVADNEATPNDFANAMLACAPHLLQATKLVHVASPCDEHTFAQLRSHCLGFAGEPIDSRSQDVERRCGCRDCDWRDAAAATAELLGDVF